jgi:hypothetical protein
MAEKVVESAHRGNFQKLLGNADRNIKLRELPCKRKGILLNKGVILQIKID